ncbi:MAG: CTP synthase [Candidatus Bathyarchaeia archaeon]
MVKYIFVTGGVMSGIGKGVTVASIGKIMQLRGMKVTAVKIDPYINVDAGTMNPYIHGEVFVTEDGGETDMDLGTYERFLDVNMSREHNITTGQIYLSVIGKERRGDFLGKCAQIIPHITDEIKERIRSISLKDEVDCAIVEVGGTVGDIESLPFLEAARQMRLEEGQLNVAYIHVTLVPVIDVVGEQKTKPTQHSVQELRRIGIMPDIIVARSKRPLRDDAKKKIALFCNVEERAVFTSPDIRSIYELPLILDGQGLGDYLSERLGLKLPNPRWDEWKNMLEGFINPKHKVRIAVCGKYAELADSYVSINEALRHAGAANRTLVEISWIETEQFEENIATLSCLDNYDGILIPGGFGARGTEGKIMAISYARERNIPFLGICFGFQMAIVEFARHVGFEGANSTEVDPGTIHPVVDLMPEQKSIGQKGATMRLGSYPIILTPGTLAHRLYGTDVIYERHRHRYEANPEYVRRLEAAGLVFSGKSVDGSRMEVVELKDRRFHLATQFHGEFKSRPNRPAPIYRGFVEAAIERAMATRTVSNI